MSDISEQAQLYLQICEMNTHGLSGFRCYVRDEINDGKSQLEVEADYHNGCFGEQPDFSYRLCYGQPRKLWNLAKQSLPYLTDDLISRTAAQQGDSWIGMMTVLQDLQTTRDIFLAACASCEIDKLKPEQGTSGLARQMFFTVDCDLICQTAPAFQSECEKFITAQRKLVTQNRELQKHMRLFQTEDADSRAMLAEMRFAEVAEEGECPTEADEAEATALFAGDMPVQDFKSAHKKKKNLSWAAASAVVALLIEENPNFPTTCKSAEDWARRITNRATQLEERGRTCSESQVCKLDAWRKKMGNKLLSESERPKDNPADAELIAKAQAARIDFLTRRQAAEGEASPFSSNAAPNRLRRTRTSA